MAERDGEEQNLRIDKLMLDIEKLRQDLRWDGRKFLLQAILAGAAAVAAGVGIGNLIWGRGPPAGQVLTVPPGTTITTPGGGGR